MSVDKQHEGISTLVVLQHNLRKLTSLKEFGFFVTNESHRLINYQTAVLWQKQPTGGVKILSVSGISKVDPHVPYIRAYCKVLDGILRNGHDDMAVINRDELPQEISNDWHETAPPSTLWFPFFDEDGEVVAGLWILRDDPWEEEEANICRWLFDAYAYTWNVLAGHSRWGWIQKYWRKYKLLYIVLPAILIILMLPVRLTVLASAEVIAKNATLITSPMNGVIEQINVSPNQQVKAGEVLFSMDKTELRNSYNKALKELAVKQAELRKTIQKSFSDVKSRAVIQGLRSQIEVEREKVKYTKELLAKSDVRAPVAGLVVFNSKDDLLGRPVQTGEKILRIAKPGQVELEVWLPVASVIPLEGDDRTKFYPNASPLSSLKGQVKYFSFDAELQSNQVLAYRVLVDFDKGDPLPRIGEQGTAKIYGERVSLLYYLLRRPLSSLRQYTGW